MPKIGTPSTIHECQILRVNRNFYEMSMKFQVKLCCSMETPVDNLFQIERLNEQEFDASLELAEDQLNLKAKTVSVFFRCR